MKMNLTKHIVPLICVVIAACSPPVLTGGKTNIKITIQGESHDLDAGPGCFWAEPVYNVSKTVAYVIRNRGSSTRGYNSESIVKVTKAGVSDPAVQNSSISQGNILKIYRVSDDGKRILVELHFTKGKSGASTYYGTRPVVLNVEEGTISEVKL